MNERLDRRSGDLVLREIATGLRASLRSHDHVARYGGAIFTVILVDTDRDVGRMVAENVDPPARASIAITAGILRLDFSAGVAVAEVSEPIGALEMIRRGDQALSAAKRDGRRPRARVGEGLGRRERGQPRPAAGDLHRRQGEGLSEHAAAPGHDDGRGRVQRFRGAGP